MTWEYKFLVLALEPANDSGDTLSDNEAALNREGADGWDVVTLLPKLGAGESWTVALLKRRSRTHPKKRRGSDKPPPLQ